MGRKRVATFHTEVLKSSSWKHAQPLRNSILSEVIISWRFTSSHKGGLQTLSSEGGREQEREKIEEKKELQEISKNNLSYCERSSFNTAEELMANTTSPAL
ncbi:hypothetical protein C0J52_26960 [Blattella germanica]|nr:hypothetical protein C0J52_26960 [Blattella germanica]